MPRLTRVRMTNVQLDEGKKMIADSLWEPNAKDALFILENGGGKTSYIQLMTQTLLPNSQLSKRLLKDVVYKGTTGHVMTEWKLDGENLPHEFVCLGFTFLNGETKKDDLNYFTYFFTYNKEDDLRIDTLPTVQEGKVTKYSQYRNLIRNFNIRPYDVNKEYRRAIRRFHFLEEEWKMIQKINGDEGGVDNYFRNASSTRDLLVKLLIPEVENTIFDTEQKKKEVQTYFKEYSINLLSIPDMKRDLRDFQVIKMNAESILQSVENYQKENLSFFEVQNEIIALKMSLEAEIDRKKNLIKELKEEWVELSQKGKDVQWKMDSYKIHEIVLEWKRQVDETAKSLKLLEISQRDLEACVRMVKTYKGYKEYEEYVSIQQKIAKVRAELSALTATNLELEENRRESKRLFNEAWVCLNEGWEEKHSKQKELVESITEKIKNKKQEVERISKEKEIVYGKRQKAIGELENYQKDVSVLQKRVGEQAATSPNTFIDRCNDDLNAIAMTIQENRETIQNNKNEMAFAAEWMRESRMSLQKMNENIASLRREQNEYEQRRAQLQSLMLKEKVESHDLFGEKEELSLHFENRRKQLEQTVGDYDREIRERNGKIKQLETYNFFVPNEQLISLQQKLEEKNVIAMLGSEWLSELSSEGLKKEYLDSYPLLPFSLLVEEAQLTEAKRVISSTRKKILDLPILLYVKSKLLSDVADSIQEGLWIFHHLEVDWFASKKKMLEWLEELRVEKGQLLEQFQHVKGTLDVLNEIIRVSKEFHSLYDDSWHPSAQEEEKKLVAESSKLQEEMASKEKEAEEKGLENEGLERSISQKEREVSRIQSLIESVEAFQEKYPEPQKIFSEQKEFKDEYERLETTHDLSKDELEVLRNSSVTERLYLNNIEAKLKELKKEKDHYGLDDSVEPSNEYTEEDKYSHLVRFEAFQKDYEEKEQLKVSVELRLADQMRQLEESNKRLLELGFSVEEIKDIYRELPGLDRLIEEKTKEELSLNKKLNEAKEWHTSSKAVAGEKEKQLNKETEALDKTYQKGTYLFRELAEDEFRALTLEKQDIFSHLQENETQTKNADGFINDAELGLNTIESLGKLPEPRQGTVPSFLPESACATHAKSWVQKYKAQRDRRDSSKIMVNTTFRSYVEKVNASGNIKVHRFTAGLSKLKESENLFDFDYMLETFNRIFDTIAAYEIDLRRKIEECEKDKDKLVDLCYQRVEAIYKNVMEIPKYSKVELFGFELQFIKMRWNRASDEETVENLRFHVESILQTLQRMKQENKEEKLMNEFLAQQLDNVALIERIAPLSGCVVTIYKPRKQSLMSVKPENWKPWDEVSQWSGGEEFSSYMSMFMILITYLRKKVNAKDDSWKVIVADNPFGKASSEHVIAPIMELSRKNKIQLFCLTAHKSEEIRSHFDTVMSNRYYSTAGIELLQVEHQGKVSMGTFSYEHE